MMAVEKEIDWIYLDFGLYSIIFEPLGYGERIAYEEPNEVMSMSFKVDDFKLAVI